MKQTRGNGFRIFAYLLTATVFFGGINPAEAEETSAPSPDGTASSAPADEIQNNPPEDTAARELEENGSATVTITYKAGEGGSVSLDEETVELSENGETPALQGSAAKADDGYYFVDWTIDDTVVSQEPVFLPDAGSIRGDATYTANFAKIAYTQTTAKGIRISAAFEDGTFPDGTWMEVKDIEDPDVVEIGREALENALEAENGTEQIDDSIEPVAVDVSFLNYDDQGVKAEVEPADGHPVHITMNTQVGVLTPDTDENEDTDPNVTLQVVHVPEEGQAQVIDNVSLDDHATEASFSVDSFSPLLVFAVKPVPAQTSAVKKIQNPAPTIINKEEMKNVYQTVGKYQLNYCGTSNGFSEDGDPWRYSIHTGFSHLEALKEIEDDHCYNADWKNSGGSKLENVSRLDKENIEKAYLTIEYNWGNERVNGYPVAQYPVTLVYGGNEEKGKVQPGSVQEFSMSEYITSDFNNNSFGYVDITEYIRKYGYGWYYCCNVPFRNNSDASADWKIVVVEKNENLHNRLIKLTFGKVVNTNRNAWSTISVSGDGIRTLQDQSKPVTGQFLYNISNSDVHDCGKVQISADGSNEKFRDVVAVNGNRTANSPLNMLKTRNTVPIAQEVNYPYPATYNDRQLVGSDVELLDIDGSTAVHNITLEHNASEVALRFNPVPCWLVTNMLGIAVDVDISAGDVTIQNTKNEGGKTIQVSGTTRNLKPENGEEPNTTIRDGKVTIDVNGNYVIDPNTIQAKLNGNTIDKSNWEVSGNKVQITFGKGGVTKPGDELTYSFSTTAVADQQIIPGTVTNIVTLTGKSFNNGTYTGRDIQIDQKSETRFTLTVDPNGGSYPGNTTVSSTMDPLSTAALSTPTLTGYKFLGWIIKSGGYRSALASSSAGRKMVRRASTAEGVAAPVKSSSFTMGLQDTVLQAQWEKETYTVTVNMHFSGIESRLFPKAFRINVGEYSGPLTIANGTKKADTEYTWKIQNVPYQTKLSLQEINYALDNYSVTTKVTQAAASNEMNPDSGNSAAFTVDQDTKVDFEIIYTHTSFTVRTEWAGDAAWKDVTRPDAVTVQLQATVNGATENVGAAVTLPYDNAWKYQWPVLKDKDDSGNVISYSVTENPVKGYDTQIASEKKSAVITNTLQTENITVKKTWKDQDNSYALRPASITIHFYQTDSYGNKREVGDARALSDANGWEDQFTALPVYDKHGNRFSYAVAEDAVPGYVSNIEQYSLTNVLETRDITVTKVWNDQNNKYGIRPGQITVQLLRNGEAFKDPVVLSRDNSWNYTFQDLPVKDADGNAYIYTASETSVSGYTTSVQGTTITNTYIPADSSEPVRNAVATYTFGKFIPSTAVKENQE